MNDAFFEEKGFVISNDQSLIDFDLVYKYLDQDSYWAKNIPMETLRKAIQNSLCFGIYQQNKQAGFARVVTDKATFAYICDVFVLPDYRKIALSKWLMQTIVNSPELDGLRRISLATADAHGLYSQFGFKGLTWPDRWMEIYRPYLPLSK